MVIAFSSFLQLFKIKINSINLNKKIKKMIKKGIFFFLISISIYYFYKSTKASSTEPEIIIRKPTPSEKTKAETWPIWTKEVSEFQYNYSQTEECLIISGEVEIITKSKIYHFSSGDFVIFPKGLECRWNIKKDVKKHYNFK